MQHNVQPLLPTPIIFVQSLRKSNVAIVKSLKRNCTSNVLFREVSESFFRGNNPPFMGLWVHWSTLPNMRVGTDTRQVLKLSNVHAKGSGNNMLTCHIG